ncbi:WD40 repeat domain-containing protein [Pannus brasiliensis CCIBt3594]|uniref:WD40 repeat domain-containing protein n=1 Tax=Pannus brasiliensis CCIBt3594 TaxID=1427578 RepID=A0AAW9QWR5_9CHRO
MATGRVVTTITHLGRVNSVTFSPDGTYLATASSDNTADLIEVATGRVVTTITHKYGVESVSFSPNGTYLATSSSDTTDQLSDKTAKLIEVATGRDVTTIRHKDEVRSVTFSPDGTYLATISRDGKAKLIKVATSRVVTTIKHESWVRSVSFSPDGTYLIARSSGYTAKLIEVETGKVVATFIDQGWVRSVSFSPDGTYLITKSSENTAKLIEVETGRVVTTIRHKDEVRSVSFSSDGTYLATIASDNILKLLNLRKLSQLLKEQNNAPLTPQPEISAIVHLDKPEAFFLGWLRVEANRHSFYEYMLEQATGQELSVSYHSPVLETNLLLQSLGFLLINAEKHYRTVYPTLIGIDETEIHVIAMQDMKQSVSAALSTLYEFIAQRMELDGQDYSRTIASFKGEIEEQIDNTEILIQVYHKLQLLLQLEGVKTTGELQTIKDSLWEIDRIFTQLLPKEMRAKIEAPVIPIKHYIQKDEIMRLVNEAEEANLIPLVVNLNNLGLLNNIVALAVTRQISPDRLLELCRFLPQTAIDKKVAIAAINKRRETHYISTFSEFSDIINKEKLIELLESAPPKTWWRR